MKKIFTLLLALAGAATGTVCKAQTPGIKLRPDASLSRYSTESQALKSDSRLLGSAIKAALLLKDTSKYDNKKGIALDQLFTSDDLSYIANQGVNGSVALFDLINQNLLKGETIAFKTGKSETIITDDNPLVLKDLRASIANRPAGAGQPQWKEIVYQGYVARDYGTKLTNTITLTAATTEMRESAGLELIDFDGRAITLAKIRSRETGEAAAVANFRALTFPSSKLPAINARENYRRALFELMRLQENAIDHHSQTQQLLTDLTRDLRSGRESHTLKALLSSTFFAVNVKDQTGPVLLTESEVINSGAIAADARAQATGILMLVALHYGERDAVILLRQLINGNGEKPAKAAGFTPQRLNELTSHGAEQFKSLGFGADKTSGMRIADLVLVAVASPAVLPQIKPDAYLAVIGQVSQSIVNTYATKTEITTITRNTVLFNPRISLNSRHTEYRAAYDPIDFVPEIQNGQFFDQRGSRITQNGVELRLESDIYFSNADKISSKGVKPVIYPEFGVLAGIGNRRVGDDQSTTAGPLGPVPRFQSHYTNWGAHVGINIGPVLIGTDATILTTPVGPDAPTRFFDLSQGMTYYRYEVLTHILNYGFKKALSLTIDLDLVGETNNEGFGNLTSTQGTDAQIKSARWNQDYDMAHPGGVYNQQIATSLLNNGYVKASYPSSNFAALNLGVEKSNLKLTGSAGLYNIHTRTGYQLYDHLLSNTLKGDLFGTVGLTYNFGSRSFTSKRTRKETYSSAAKAPQVEESSADQSAKTSGPRNHAIFTNKK